MNQPKIIESGISPTLYCGCGLPLTYHKRDDDTTLYRCDFCDQLVGHSRTAHLTHEGQLVIREWLAALPRLPWWFWYAYAGLFTAGLVIAWAQ